MFTLSKNLLGHKGEVRCGCVLKNNNLFVTGGLDGLLIVWDRNTFTSSRVITGAHSDFIYSVCPHPFNPDWFISGGKDKRVLVFDAVSGDKVMDLETGRLHAGPVCSLAAMEKIVVVGSWDGTFSVWSLETGELIKHHRKEDVSPFAVAVAVNERTGEILAAGQDKSLQIWSGETLEMEIPNAHMEIIRSIKVDPATGHIFTCSNDCLVKIRTPEAGRQESVQLVGHENFVFSVSFMFPLCVSSGEDKTARVWQIDNAAEIQTIKHPGTVWFSEFWGDNAHMATGCSDGILRIFSSVESENADSEQIKAFESAAAAANVPASSQIDPSTVPLETSMFRYRGNKEGEIKMFKDGASNVYAYQWCGNSWEKIGLVTGAGPSEGTKKKGFPGDQYFQAGEYDYVFDVELGEGGAMAKLPFNVGDNPLVTAEKFIAREKINKSNLEQIVQFITTNAPTQELTSPAAPAKKDEPAVFPTDPILFREAKWPQLLAKLTDVMRAVTEFTVEETKIIQDVVELLQQPPSHLNRDFRPIEIALIHTKLVSFFPPESLFAVFDLWRLFALHKSAAVMYKDSDQGSQYMQTAARFLANSQPNNTGLCAARYLANLFGASVSKWAAVDRFQIYLPAVKQALLGPGVPRGTQTACAAIVANLAASTAEKRSVKSMELATVLVKTIVEILNMEIALSSLDPDALYKLLLALATAKRNQQEGVKERTTAIVLPPYTRFPQDHAGIREVYSQLTVME